MLEEVDGKGYIYGGNHLSRDERQRYRVWFAQWCPNLVPPVLSCYVLEIMLASLFSMVASKSPFSRCPGCFLMFFLSHHHDRPFKRTDLFSDLAFEVTLNRSKITCRRARSDGRK